MRRLRGILNSDTGASMVEYALLVALIALIAFSAVTMMGHATESSLMAVGEELAGYNAGDPGTPTPGDEDEDPSEQGDPEHPGDPSNPENPGDPGTPSNPGNPGQPGDPEQPGDPSDPSDPEAPEQPGNPSDPGTPVGPGNPGSDEPEEPAEPGSEASSTGSDAEFYWWNDKANGGEGAWTASVSFDNDWIRHQYLTIEVTTVDHTGKRVTTTVKDFYVPANGNATYVHWNNNLKVVNGVPNGIVAVEFKVVTVKTSDINWKSVTYPVTNPTPITVKAPA